MPDRIPRSVPDEEFNEIFAALPSHRDRALVAFYVSTGARASELLSATVAGLDPGRQLITVVRKGTRELQQLPASTDAFVWLRLYQVEMEELIPKGRRQPLWWTLRRPARPLSYHAAHRMFERVNQRVVGTENPCHQAIFMNHAPCAVTPLDPELIQVCHAVGQRAQRRGLAEGLVGSVSVIEVLLLAQHDHQVPLVPAHKLRIIAPSARSAPPTCPGTRRGTEPTAREIHLPRWHRFSARTGTQ